MEGVLAAEHQLGAARLAIGESVDVGAQLLRLGALDGGELSRPGIGAVTLAAAQADAGDGGTGRRRRAGAMPVERQRINPLGAGLVGVPVEQSRKLAKGCAIALLEKALGVD